MLSTNSGFTLPCLYLICCKDEFADEELSLYMTACTPMSEVTSPTSLSDEDECNTSQFFFIFFVRSLYLSRLSSTHYDDDGRQLTVQNWHAHFM